MLFYRQLSGLRRRWPQLRTELAVGGWEDSQQADYAAMAANATGRAMFAASAAADLEKFGFDGLHMDWEHPSGDRQRRDFSLLMAALRDELTPRGLRLSVAVPAGPYQARTSYEMGTVARLADRIMLMAYDFHGGWRPRTADHHAALRPRSTDFSGLDALSGVHLWMAEGATARQLVLGVPLYGRGWELEDASAAGPPPLAARGVAPAGPDTVEAGVLSYLEICSNLLQRGWTSQQVSAGGGGLGGGGRITSARGGGEAAWDSRLLSQHGQGQG